MKDTSHFNVVKMRFENTDTHIGYQQPQPPGFFLGKISVLETECRTGNHHDQNAIKSAPMHMKIEYRSDSSAPSPPRLANNTLHSVRVSLLALAFEIHRQLCVCLFASKPNRGNFV